MEKAEESVPADPAPRPDAAERYLRLLSETIHSAVAATADADGRPETRAVDVMLADADGVYFLTARGKTFYRRLTEQGYLALTAVKDGESVSVRGRVRCIGKERLDEIFEKNPYMGGIYPGATRDALEVFVLCEGRASTSTSAFRRAFGGISFRWGAGRCGRAAGSSGTDAPAAEDACPSARSAASACPRDAPPSIRIAAFPAGDAEKSARRGPRKGGTTDFPAREKESRGGKGSGTERGGIWISTNGGGFFSPRF